MKRFVKLALMMLLVLLATAIAVSAVDSGTNASSNTSGSLYENLTWPYNATFPPQPVNQSVERLRAGERLSNASNKTYEEIQGAINEIRPSQETKPGEEAQESKAEKAEAAGNNTTARAPGFEVALGLIGILAAAAIWRRL